MKQLHFFHKLILLRGRQIRSYTFLVFLRYFITISSVCKKRWHMRKVFKVLFPLLALTCVQNGANVPFEPLAARHKTVSRSNALRRHATYAMPPFRYRTVDPLDFIRAKHRKKLELSRWRCVRARGCHVRRHARDVALSRATAARARVKCQYASTYVGRVTYLETPGTAMAGAGFGGGGAPWRRSSRSARRRDRAGRPRRPRPRLLARSRWRTTTGRTRTPAAAATAVEIN